MQIRVALIGAALSLLCLNPEAALAQGSRSAAAEAYDRGTSAYLDGSYEKAAQWFETANRLAPAAPALMQAVRAHYKAGNTLKASSLALQLKLEYGAEPSAVKYADSILDENAAQYVQVQVHCDDCSLEVDGSVQQYPVFFVEPSVGHTISATFSTGAVSEELSGNAGETRELSFEAPPPPPPEEKPEVVEIGPTDETPKEKEGRSGLSPVVFFVGAGVTVGLTVGAIVTGLGAKSAVDDYNAASKEYLNCQDEPTCDSDMENALYKTAKSKLDDSESKVTIRNVMFAMTGVFGAATAVIGIFFTDWKGGEKSDAKASLGFDVAPLPGGGFATLKGRF